MGESTAESMHQGGVALALGAGGIKGWAHAGVIRVLHDAGMPISMVCGASAGVRGRAAALKALPAIERLVASTPSAAE